MPQLAFPYSTTAPSDDVYTCYEKTSPEKDSTCEKDTELEKAGHDIVIARFGLSRLWNVDKAGTNCKLGPEG